MAEEKQQRTPDLLTRVSGIVSIAAIIAAGAWTIYSHAVLKDAEHAVVKLEEARLALQRAASVEEEQANVQATMELLSETGPDGDLLVRATVVLENIGRRNALVGFKERGLCIANVTYPKGVEALGETTCAPKRIDEVLLRRGLKHRAAYLVRVPAPGVYRVDFRADLGPEETRDAVRSGAQSSRAYGAYDYIVVRVPR